MKNPFDDFLKNNVDTAWAQAKEQIQVNHTKHDVFALGFKFGAWRVFELIAQVIAKRKPL
jgi:hypothetical protein